MLLDIPDQFETERLLIRVPRPGDGAEINKAVLESLDDLRAWLPWVQVEQTVAVAEEAVRQAVVNFYTRESMRLSLYRKSDGLLVGSSGLHNIDWTVPRFEIGYWVRNSMQGQGYITEAVTGITNFAFDTLNAERIEIRCDALNERSAAVARRVGYTLEACLCRQSRSADGNSLRDTLLFAMIRSEWLERQNS
ncbi:MAG: GNAT family N-acetyltransferase [Anaerolineae bacterium]|nr:GNAT family N-acetyltransferase [Anaerolineae bacterium]